MRADYDLAVAAISDLPLSWRPFLFLTTAPIPLAFSFQRHSRGIDSESDTG